MRSWIFKPEMVHAILADLKSQTRRILSAHNSTVNGYGSREAFKALDFDDAWSDPGGTMVFGPGPYLWAKCRDRGTGHRVRSRIEVGDILYVRETFYIDDERLIGERLPKEKPAWLDDRSIYYRADGECCEQIPECACVEVGKPKWRPSIFMPQWASRMKLMVIEVRIERLKSIQPRDITAEGVEVLGGSRHWRNGHAVSIFRSLWESIHGAGSWDENPWLWAYTFERVPDGEASSA